MITQRGSSCACVTAPLVNCPGPFTCGPVFLHAGVSGQPGADGHPIDPPAAWRISEDSTSGNRRRKGPAGTGPRSCRILARGHPTPPLRPCARRADRLRPAHEKGPDQVRRAEVGNNDQRERVMFGWLRLTAGRRSTAGIARLIHAPAAAVDFPAGQSGATCGQREQHAIGTVNEWFYGCSPR